MLRPDGRAVCAVGVLCGAAGALMGRPAVRAGSAQEPGRAVRCAAATQRCRVSACTQCMQLAAAMPPTNPPCAYVHADHCCACSCYNAADYKAGPSAAGCQRRLPSLQLGGGSSSGEAVAVINIGGHKDTALKYEVWQQSGSASVAPWRLPLPRQCTPSHAARGTCSLPACAPSLNSSRTPRRCRHGCT